MNIQHELRQAAREGNTSKIEECLRRDSINISDGININELSHRENATALYLAVDHRHQAAVELLLKRRDVDRNVLCEDGFSTLYVAVLRQENRYCSDTVKAIVEANTATPFNIDTRNTAGSKKTALLKAAELGLADMAEYLASKGANPLIKDAKGKDALALLEEAHLPVARGNVICNAIAYAINNELDDHLLALVAYPRALESVYLVRLLDMLDNVSNIESAAAIYALEKILYQAIDEEDRSCIGFFLNSGFDISKLDRRVLLEKARRASDDLKHCILRPFEKLLIAAAKNNDTAQVQEWVELGVDIDAPESNTRGNGYNALQFAIEAKDVDAVELYLSLGASPNAVYVTDLEEDLALYITPLGLAIALEGTDPSRQRVIDLLRSHPETSLARAVSYYDLAAVKLLVEDERKLFQPVSNGGTVLHHVSGWAGIISDSRASARSKEMLAFLLTTSLDPLKTDNDGCTPYDLFGHKEFARALRGAGLVQAAGVGDLDTVQALIDEDPNLTNAVVGPHKLTPLCVAAVNNQTAVLRVLLSHEGAAISQNTQVIVPLRRRLNHDRLNEGYECLTQQMLVDAAEMTAIIASDDSADHLFDEAKKVEPSNAAASSSTRNARSQDIEDENRERENGHLFFARVRRMPTVYLRGESVAEESVLHPKC